ncbi:MAG: tRNA lysidine(34) synthetase TilS [Elusimicrobia bacterium RIFOXYA2_FULL_50_26]|nr:MAG: tRNA lysidine(34) synthetase TilS [Elusimicrobia bacterium RIFOXYA2_FULL_50_26]
MEAWESFKKTVAGNKLIEPGAGVLAAVSGGPDSMCMLHMLWRLKKTVPFDLYCVSIDHGLRNVAKKEVAAVSRWCQSHGIASFVRRIPVASYARENKLSVETAGRMLRYEIFKSVAMETGCGSVATGHTANDTAETALMWIIRGAGTEGLSGIPMARPLTGDINVIRPLHSITREEIMRYLRRQGMPYFTDVSNKAMDYTRNRIRSRLLPLLKTFNPRIVEHLYNLTQIISRENEYLQSVVSREISKSAHVGGSRITLALKRFIGYNKVIQARILKNILPEKLSSSQIERLLDWVSLSDERKMIFSRRWSINKNRHSLTFRKTK